MKSVKNERLLAFLIPYIKDDTKTFTNMPSSSDEDVENYESEIDQYTEYENTQLHLSAKNINSKRIDSSSCLKENILNHITLMLER